MSRVYSPLKKKDRWNIEKFSVTLLEKEIELEKHFSRETIEDLITLYSEAIEHYNEISDPKFYDFQDKLHSLLLRPEVSSVINQQDLPGFYSLSKRKNRSSYQQAVSKILEKSQKNCLNLSKPSQESLQKSIQSNIETQNSNLREKITQRRSRKQAQNESFSSTNSSNSERKEKIESLMEVIYSQKSKQISDVTFEYLLKINEASEEKKQVLANELKQKIILISKVHEQFVKTHIKKFKIT